MKEGCLTLKIVQAGNSLTILLSCKPVLTLDEKPRRARVGPWAQRAEQEATEDNS